MVSHLLADEKQGVRPLLIKLNQLVDSVETQEVKEAIRRTNKILVQLEQATDPSTSQDSLHAKLDKTLTHLDQLLEDIKKNPKRYMHLSVFGKK